jgi:putative ABC transport system permease protein
MQDLRYAVRMLFKNPGFTLIAVITLALGIGANTAIFSVVSATVLRALPYPNADRLVMVWGTNAKDGNQQQPASFGEFNDAKAQARSFDELAGASPQWNFVLMGGGEPEPVRGMWVSANLFATLGVMPARGRAFSPEEDRVGGAPVVMLSHGLWQRRYGADPDVIGKTLSLGGTACTIVGVMPAGFHFLDAAELWVPLQQNQLAGSTRNVRLLSIVGRLKAGVSSQQANAELDQLARQWAAQYPDTNAGLGLRMVSMHRQVAGKVRFGLSLLFGVIGLVLLIACVNVANLMLARSAARRKEMAVRAALGAGRLRLVRQLLIESVALALVGGAAGVLLAVWGMDLLLKLNPVQLPQYHKIEIDLVVLVFSVLASVLTGLLSGLAPALQASKLDLHAALKEGGRGARADGGQRRLSKLLVIAEVAMALVLLVGAGLLARSFARLLEINPGFATENLLTMQLGLPNATYAQPERRIAFYQQLEARLSAMPEVASVGLVTRLPLQSALNNVTSFLSIEGRPVPPSQRPEIDFRRASTNYFQTMGIPLLTGRLVTEQDVVADTRSVMINDAMAKRFFPGENPVGKRISTSNISGEEQWRTIAGVVGSVRHLGLEVEPRPEIYYHTNTLPPFGPVFVIRTTSDPSGLIAAVRSAVRSIERDAPISNVSTMTNLVAQSLAQRRFAMLLLGLFAGLALLLAGVGIYGVFSYSVTGRTREIGVRMALGARAGDVLTLVVGQGMATAAIGIGVGLFASAALTRLMTNWLFAVSATDPPTFALVALLLAAVALAACWIPARRATRVDPMSALRCD